MGGKRAANLVKGARLNDESSKVVSPPFEIILVDPLKKCLPVLEKQPSFEVGTQLIPS